MPNVAAYTSAGIHREQSSLGALVFGALGVVYGDIGTSPLYALKEMLRGRARHRLSTQPTCSACCR